MGDMADDWNEAGEDALIAHHAGTCEDWCQYCADQAAKLKKQTPRKDRSRKCSTGGAEK